MEQPYTINIKNEKLVCYERLTAAVCYNSSLHRPRPNELSKKRKTLSKRYNNYVNSYFNL